MSNKILYAHFIASKVGASGLTVTCDVDKIARADLTRTAVATGASATELRNGLYCVLVSNVDEATYDYTATFKTSDSTVDQQHIAALHSDQTDPAIGTTIATAVWAAGTRTLTSFGTLVADIWSYSTRTFTNLAAAVQAALSGSTITVYRGTSWSISITGLGTLTGYSKLWFTVKDGAGKTDAQAIVQIAKYSSGSGDGLLYLNGAPASDATKGSITIDSAALGNITIALDEAVSKLLVPATNLNYDIKVLNGGNVSELADGTSKFNIRADYTRTVA